MDKNLSIGKQTTMDEDGYIANRFYCNITITALIATELTQEKASLNDTKTKSVPVFGR